MKASAIKSSKDIPLFEIPFRAIGNECFGSDPKKSEHRRKIFGDDLEVRSKEYLDYIYQNRGSRRPVPYKLPRNGKIETLKDKNSENVFKSSLPMRSTEMPETQTVVIATERQATEAEVEATENAMIASETVSGAKSPKGAISETSSNKALECISPKSQNVDSTPVNDPETKKDDEANTVRLNQNELPQESCQEPASNEEAMEFGQIGDLQEFTIQIEEMPIDTYLQQMEPGCTSATTNICPMHENCPLKLPVSYDVRAGIQVQQIDLFYNESSNLNQETLVNHSNIFHSDACHEKKQEAFAKRMIDLELFVKALKNLENATFDDGDIITIQKALWNKICRLRNQVYNAKKRQSKPSTAIVGRKRSSDVEKALSNIEELKMLLNNSYKTVSVPFYNREKICFVLKDCIACIEQQNSRKPRK